MSFDFSKVGDRVGQSIIDQLSAYAAPRLRKTRIIGQFEQSKKVAEALIDEKRWIEREKSERLKALRLAREQQTSGQDIQG